MSFVLDLTRGQARVRQVVFNRGQPRPTVSIGRAAAWSLVADDLEDVHAFVSFDGAALMVRSAEEHNPALLDGRAVPCAWTPVGRASILALGNARIAVTAKEDHAPPGYGDDDEVTGQIELRPTSANERAAARAPAPREPDPAGDGMITGDEPTGEVTGARAPQQQQQQRGLLPKPRVPPRAGAGAHGAIPAPTPPPPRREVPDFEDKTQLRHREELPAARGSRPAPLPVVPDDEERTQALDLQAMQAAQATQRPAVRPVRPNIAIAPDTDEATRMLSVAQPSPAADVQRRRVGRPAPVSVAPPSAPPMFQQPVPVPAPTVSISEPPPDDPSRDSHPPASGATQLRPMIAPPIRPPNANPSARTREETLIDPFAATGGNPTAARGMPAGILPVMAPGVTPGLAPGMIPGTADITGPNRVVPGDGAPPPEPGKAKKKFPVWIAPAGVVLFFVTYFGSTYARMHNAVPTGQVDPQPGPTIPALPEAGAQIPVISNGVAVTDAGTAMITPNRSTLPLPEFPHKGLVDAGPVDAGMADGGLATLQRAAVDAVAEGDLGRAILYYEQLAALDPDVRAYSAAARILRAQIAADAGRF